MIQRRQFLVSLTAGTSAVALAPRIAFTADPASSKRRIMTVGGPVPVPALGIVLPHEHITTDFVGAERFVQPRYSRDQATTVILPHLKALRGRGITALCECTPNYIGRDVRLLRQLSEASGIHIVTNTGYYGAVGNKYLPRHAHEETAEQLAARWLREWTDGIDGTGIKPGFIKLGVDRGKLPPLHEKLVRAAARMHRTSDLTICIHTGDGVAALDEFRILADEGIRPDAFVWVHAQNDSGPVQIDLAKRGAWVSLDGYNLGVGTPERYRDWLVALREAGCLNRVLVSHDDGWAVEGDQERSTGLKLFGNGNPDPYTSIFTRLLPDLSAAGFSQSELDQLTIRNPAEALAIGQ
jgi:phosphotriesterase-related protein